MTADEPQSKLPEGWYEFVTTAATTCIAYVREGGGVYLPDSTPVDWATARERRPLVRVADVLRQQRPARVLADLRRAMPSIDNGAELNVYSLAQIVDVIAHEVVLQLREARS